MVRTSATHSTHLLRGEDGRAAVRLQLRLELVGRRLDGHARAVEAEGEERVLAQQPVEARRELLRCAVIGMCCENGGDTVQPHEGPKGPCPPPRGVAYKAVSNRATQRTALVME